MKRTLILIATVILTVTCIAAREARVFAELSKIPGVTSVYVGAAMMKYGLSASEGNISSAGFKIGAISNPGGLELLNAETPEAASRLRKAASGLLSGNKSNIIVETKDDSDSVTLFSPNPLADGKIKDLIIEIGEKNGQYTLIYIHGDVELDEL